LLGWLVLWFYAPAAMAGSVENLASILQPQYIGSNEFQLRDVTRPSDSTMLTRISFRITGKWIG